METPIEIRAHHLACIPRFYHGGYDKRFADNMKRVCTTIRKNPEVKIKVIIGKLDALCMECPHRYRDGCIQSSKIGKWVLKQDRKTAKHLGIESNSVRKARDVFNLSMEKINNETIGSVCRNCIFLENCIKVGINNSFRMDLSRWRSPERI